MTFHNPTAEETPIVHDAWHGRISCEEAERRLRTLPGQSTAARAIRILTDFQAGRITRRQADDALRHLGRWDFRRVPSSAWDRPQSWTEEGRMTMLEAVEVVLELAEVVAP